MVATVAMGNPTGSGTYEWESGVLTNDTTYQFAVRIGTNAWPAGTESVNVDTYAATADSDEPNAPDLEVELA